MNVVKEATITAQYVNQPKAGKKNGTIKCPDESFYLAKPPILAQFQPGGQYKIGFEEYEIGGTHFKEIKTVEQVAGASAPSQGQAAGQSSHGHDDGLAERIFVCGALNAAMNNPNVKPYEIEGRAAVRFVDMWRRVFALTFGKGPVSLSKDEMNDEIPF